MLFEIMKFSIAVSLVSEAVYENANGMPFVLKKDFLGENRSKNTIAGPFAKLPSYIFRPNIMTLG
ncbi:MAG: hypothetical protein ACI4TF_11525 [Oliverpabstia sp.]